MAIDDQFIKWQRGLKTDRRAREESIQIHRDGTVHGQTQDIIAVAPIFDEGNVWMSEGGGSGHDLILSGRVGSNGFHLTIMAPAFSSSNPVGHCVY